MSNFRVGDIVRRVYNLSRHIGPFFDGKPFKITEPPINGFVRDPDGRVHASSQLRLEQPADDNEQYAVKLLLELGYTVEAPPKPKTGKIAVGLVVKENSTFVLPYESWEDHGYSQRNGHKLLAIVDWTEGEGI